MRRQNEQNQVRTSFNREKTIGQIKNMNCQDPNFFYFFIAKPQVQIWFGWCLYRLV